MQPICQQRPVNFTVRCKKYPENAVKSTVYLLFLQYIVLSMFLHYIGLKNGRILLCTVKFYMHLLYIFTIQCKFYRGSLADWLPAFLL